MGCPSVQGGSGTQIQAPHGPLPSNVGAGEVRRERWRWKGGEAKVGRQRWGAENGEGKVGSEGGEGKGTS